jgi:hypothetical protein
LSACQGRQKTALTHSTDAQSPAPWRGDYTRTFNADWIQYQETLVLIKTS